MARPLDSQKGEAYWKEAASQARVDLDQVAAHNHGLPLAFHRSIRRRQIDRLEQAISALPAPPRVLDLGCGPGVWALELQSRVRSWLGFDIAPTFVEEATRQARERGLEHLEFRVGSLVELPFQGLFDLVIMGGTLGLFDDRQLPELLETVHRHMAPDSLAYVRVSTVPWPYPRLTIRHDLPVRYRRVEHYLSLFRAAGFEPTFERDMAFSEASLATIYCYVGRRLGLSGETCCRLAQRSFPLFRPLLDLTPLPRSTVFWLRPA
ncbi:class I SAM-dependent methyltransferase [bacterium CPR1]|nr:class I SAM-dependent methyltransferase [bacterium CPR1]